MFQVYINILIFPMGKNPRRDISPQEFFPMGIFFSAQYSSLEDFNQWKSIFSAFIHIYIVYGMDSAQLLHVVVKKAGKLYFRFTWSQTQRQIFTLCCLITVFTVKLHLLGPPACAIYLFTLQRVYIQIRHISDLIRIQTVDIVVVFLNLLRIVIKLILISAKYT